MRIVVAGGTGLVGSQVVERLQAAGHEAVVASRSGGVDLLTGDGLAAALTGADAVVDASNTAAQTPEETTAFFGAVATNLLAAEQAAGVGHHVLLSITNMDRTGVGNAHTKGKQCQEAIVQAGPVPWSIVRAAQFFEFGDLVAGWTRKGDTVRIPPVRLQPVAVSDVARLLADVATGAPQGVVSLSGPEPVDFLELVERTFAARGEAVDIVPSFDGMPFGPDTPGRRAPRCRRRGHRHHDARPVARRTVLVAESLGHERGASARPHRRWPTPPARGCLLSTRTRSPATAGPRRPRTGPPCRAPRCGARGRRS